MDRSKLKWIVIFQIIPLLIVPPSMLFNNGVNVGALALMAALAVVYALLGWGLLKHREWALTLSIFFQGLNIVVRLMMLLPNMVSKQGAWDISLGVFFIISMCLSGWMMARLDKPDIRALVTA